MNRILIIDDHEKIRNIYTRLLKQAGFMVHWASNAQQAISVLAREHVDLILLDIQMPRIDGCVMFDIIERDYPRSKVVVSSVYPVEKQKELIPHATDYYDKSESLSHLLEKVNEVLGPTRQQKNGRGKQRH